MCVGGGRGTPEESLCVYNCVCVCVFRAPFRGNLALGVGLKRGTGGGREEDLWESVNGCC